MEIIAIILGAGIATFAYAIFVGNLLRNRKE
jgi:hypothetical protein